MQITFEKQWYDFPATSQLPALRCLPDFEVVVDTGEINLFEAKASKARLTGDDQETLANTGKHFAAQGRVYQVIFHDELKANGFIETIFFLRPYGLLQIPATTRDNALARLDATNPLPIERWRSMAKEQRVPVSVLNYLLYHQQLPLTYRIVLHPELLQWRE